MSRALSRRGMFKAGAVIAAAVSVPVTVTGSAAAAPASFQVPGPRSLLGFAPVAPNTLDAVVVPAGYEHTVVIRWGDPIIPGAPAFDFAHQTPQAQAGQFGYNCDFVALLPYRQLPHLSLLVVNHEFTSEPFMFLGYDEANPTREQVETAWAAHGLSVVLVAHVPTSSRLIPFPHPVDRRITVTTKMQFTGPAAGSPLDHTSADPSGRVVLAA